jgi:hypothetical protein
MWRQPGRLPERPCEVSGGQSTLFGKLRHQESLVESRNHELFCPSFLPRREPPSAAAGSRSGTARLAELKSDLVVVDPLLTRSPNAQRTHTSEIRPVVGANVGRFDFIFNPILDGRWLRTG